MLNSKIELSVARIHSPIGTLLLVTDAEERIRALDFPQGEARMLRLLQLHYGERGYRLASGEAPEFLRRSFERFFVGELNALSDLPVETGGSDFQRQVWAQLRRIPPGALATYGELATLIGRPKARRAVGAANGANPVSVVVPCHRVIGHNGSLTGYAGGLERKRWLLEHERKSSARASDSAGRKHR